MIPWRRYALVVTLLGACGSASDREVVGPRHVPASGGAPEVLRIVDLGDLAAIPAHGDISTAASDGHYVIGELVLIEGNDFGKLPTISIGGKPSKSLARTKGGGIVTRIPAEVDAGTVRVEVSHPDGRDDKSIVIRRYLTIASPEAVHLSLADVTGQVTEAGSLDIKGVTDLCFSHDGQAMYLAIGKDRSLKAISMAAKNGPRLASGYSLGTGNFVELACRPGVTTVAALDRAKVRFFDGRVATALSVSGEVALSDEAVGAALSPDGHWLAVLGASNTLSLVSIAERNVVASLTVLENETVPLLRDLEFSPDGDEIWVLSGNSAQSVVAGTRPTQISQVAVQDDALSLVGSATIGLAAAPRFLAVSQRESVMAAAAVRSTSDRATLLLTSLSASSLSGVAGQGSVDEKGTSSLLRFDLDGHAVALAEGTNVLSRALVSHDQKWAYAAAQSPSGLGLIFVPLPTGNEQYLQLSTQNYSSPRASIALGIAP